MFNHVWIRSAAISVMALITLIWLFRSPIGVMRDRLTESAPTAEPCIDSERHPTIPNIVHYVHLLKEPTADIHFEFKHFISIYSATLHLQPDAIYIHTDAPDEAIARARGPGSAADKWTRLILNMPRLRIEKVTAPEYAGNGVKIANLENKSDFVRAKAVYDHGGSYFDWDVHALRDLSPLRRAGFASIVGLQKYGETATGAYMAVRHAELMRLWLANEHVVYDGGWVTHAVTLLNRLARRLAAIPNEVLILEEPAFSGSSWEGPDMEYLFGPHLEVPPSNEPGRGGDGAGDGKAELDAEALWASRGDRLDWEADYSSTYVLHAFRRHDAPPIKDFDGITLEYVLARQSNFARAVYPAVRHAIDAGIISPR